LKTHPEQPDSEVTVESVIEARVIYGSPQTVAEKLLAFRQQVGPFGHVLVTGTDWGGPNREWEQESMQRLADEVRPLLRRQTTTRAAE
jgi:alkanesulfonate monooxygenase SsuD/methylene tetrahydromethanopterin reductase-like flavin-dependent oxidoreductase (luciferase family)